MPSLGDAHTSSLGLEDKLVPNVFPELLFYALFSIYHFLSFLKEIVVKYTEHKISLCYVHGSAVDVIA